MRGIADTIFRLHGAGHSAAASAPSPATLSELRDFGSNPGALKGWYAAPTVEHAVPLVVVLHGCTQTAHGYDRGSGWSDLGARHGFAVLLPEQQRSNNPNLCFNWFAPGDTRRDGGEALSIRQMIAAMVADHAIDPARIFVTGLSAGGAMTSAMLATYPEVFAGGAIIAGLPHGAAATAPQAFDRMRGHGHVPAEASAAAVRAASPHRGRWPRVAVWHGTADRTVDAINADAIIDQWRALHGVAQTPDRTETVDGQQHEMWLDDSGVVRLERYTIAGMAHGTPLNTDGPTRSGEPTAYMLDAGISSTWHIANGWGLIDPAVVFAPTSASDPARAAGAVSRPAQDFGVQAMIESALRSAGLMK